MTVTIVDIHQAAERIRPNAHRTPVLTKRSLDERLGTRLYLKCENLQKVGAFKFRGACNAVFALTDAEAARGVVAHSSGNHAQSLALARLRGIPATIVVPNNAPAVKKAVAAGPARGLSSASRPWKRARPPRPRSLPRLARWRSIRITMNGSLPGRLPPRWSCCTKFPTWM